MIKVSLREIHDGKPHLEQLATQFLDLELSITVSQALAVFEQQTKLMSKAFADKAGLLGFTLGQTVNDPPKLIEPIGEDYTVKPETIEQFNKAAEEFLDSTFIQLPIEKITRKMLEASKAKTTPVMIGKLSFLFDFFSKVNEAKPEKLALVKKQKNG